MANNSFEQKSTASGEEIRGLQIRPGWRREPRPGGLTERLAAVSEAVPIVTSLHARNEQTDPDPEPPTPPEAAFSNPRFLNAATSSHSILGESAQRPPAVARIRGIARAFQRAMLGTAVSGSEAQNHIIRRTTLKVA